MKAHQVSLLLVAMLVTFVTGSIHSFSVFLVPFEQLLGLDRAEVSLFYSLALVFLTVSVLLGHHIYERFSPFLLVTSSCLMAGAGLGLAAFADTWLEVFIGYSVLFGLANGVAYGYVLQLSGRALPKQKGFAMAAVTAAYAVGSVVFSFILGTLVQAASLRGALVTLGTVIASAGILSGLVMRAQKISYDCAPPAVASQHTRLRPVAWLWLAYGCSVFAGLMAIGHAAGIIQSLGGDYTLAVWGAVLVGIGSSIGGFFIGTVISRANMEAWLLALPVTSAVFLVALVFASKPMLAMWLLSGVGFAYGAVISVYPFAISEYFGNRGPKIYGQVFTAWGLSGLAGPWVAGWIFDASGNYQFALVVASAIALVSTAAYLYTSRRVIVN